jgi:MYXO-CTERM domain-containing protein
MGQGVGGVSPFTEDCGVIPNSIVFTFAGVYGSAYRDICETAAQEVSHSFGLDHEYQCKDPMTYLSGCGDKAFQDNLERCGEYSARTCWCGGTTQNSVAMLRERLGPRETPDNDDVLASGELAVAVADEDPNDGDGNGDGDGDSDGDGNGDTITGGCATAGDTGGAFVLLGIALVALRRRKL